jgi:transposase InsO family protein
MAVWRRKPRHRVLIHSDQGAQFTSMDWAAFIRAHNLEHSMSRRGNCHDKAVAESFFSSLKRERIIAPLPHPRRSRADSLPPCWAALAARKIAFSSSRSTASQLPA